MGRLRQIARVGAWCGAIALLVGLSVFALSRAVPLPERLRAQPGAVVEFRDGSPAYVFLSPDDKWRAPVSLGAVDPAYVTALVRLEDKRFWRHAGVDPVAVARAALTNLVRGRRVSGASTLTMQLVRVLEPRPRTLRSKVVEAFRAVQLELRLSKKEILTAYLQLAPYGKNIEGVEAASMAYFGHRATHLSGAEIATLLAVPQNPNRRYPCPENAARLLLARDAIARRLLAEHALPLGKGAARIAPAAALAQVEATPALAALQSFPRFAPHAALWLHAQDPAALRIRTTLDRGAQIFSEQTMARARGDLARRGIHNGAAVIVDHASAEIVALVGNFDFWDAAHGGQIAGFVASRSTGSALKPFLYAMAIDRGLAGPDSLVEDVPVAFGSYMPKNYDGTYSGLLRLEDALSRSLNVPFVNLLQIIGVEPFLGQLREMGVTSLDPEPGHYGLSAVIGGIELTPLELAGLYAALARGGSYAPLRLVASPGRAPAARVFSPGATYLTRRALSLRDRPDLPSRRQVSGAPPRVFWKTGTSSGHRDAWAAGWGPRHAAVVWTGNFDDSPSVELVGAEASGPLLFDLLEGLAERSRPPGEDGPPPDLVPVEVCAYSGHLATDACPEKKTVLLPREHVPTAPCPYHVKVDVDVKTGKALTATCRAGHAYEARDFTVWPASLRRWLRDQGRRAPEPPELAAGCLQGGARNPPTILSPAAGQVVMLLRGVSESKQEVPLEAESAGGGAKLSWFVDGEYLGTVKAEERAWWRPVPGVHELLVADESGLTARRRLEVRPRVQ